jgi:hypothetical protein
LTHSVAVGGGLGATPQMVKPPSPGATEPSEYHVSDSPNAIATLVGPVEPL